MASEVMQEKRRKGTDGKEEEGGKIVLEYKIYVIRSMRFFARK